MTTANPVLSPETKKTLASLRSELTGLGTWCHRCHDHSGPATITRIDPQTLEATVRCHGEEQAARFTRAELRGQDDRGLMRLIHDRFPLLGWAERARRIEAEVREEEEMTNLADRLEPFTGRLPCHVCRGWAEHVEVIPSASRDAYEVNIRCHGRHQHFMLDRADTLGRPPADMFERIARRATILTTPPAFEQTLQAATAEAAREFRARWTQHLTPLGPEPAPPDGGATATIRDRRVSLDDLGTALERCRNLVSGLPIRTIFLPDEDFARAHALVRRVAGAHDGPTVGGFAVDHQPESGEQLLWRDVRVEPVRRKPLLGDVATLDLSAVPFVYVNGANHPMECWPPWAPRAPRPAPFRDPPPADRWDHPAAPVLRTSADNWTPSGVTTGWGETLESPVTPRRSRTRSGQIMDSPPPPVPAVPPPGARRKIVIRKRAS